MADWHTLGSYHLYALAWITAICLVFTIAIYEGIVPIYFYAAFMPLSLFIVGGKICGAIESLKVRKK